MKARWIWISLTMTIVIVVGLFVAMSGSPIRTSAEIDGASLIDDDRIELWLGCGTGVVWHVEEFADRVVADVRMFHRPGDCAAGAVIELAEPLGARPVIDAATGNEVEVGNR